MEFGGYFTRVADHQQQLNALARANALDYLGCRIVHLHSRSTNWSEFKQQQLTLLVTLLLSIMTGIEDS